MTVLAQVSPKGLRRVVQALVFGLSGIVAGLGTEVAAQEPPALIDGLSLAGMQEILQNKGYRAELVTEADDWRYIRSATSGYTFFINFYDCADDAPYENCKSIEFVTGSFTAEPALAADRLAAWNRDNWWGFGVYDSEGLPYLRTYISTAGGVTEAYIANMIELWDWRVVEFAKFVSQPANASPASASPAND